MWARIEDSTVKELTQIDPAGRFHEALIWRPCSVEIEVGWSYSGGAFKAPPPLSRAEIETLERNWRDATIDRVKWLVERHRGQTELSIATTLSSEQYRELLVYVQMLRDWPQSPDFPAQQLRPVAPAWIIDLTQ